MIIITIMTTIICLPHCHHLSPALLIDQSHHHHLTITVTCQPINPCNPVADAGVCWRSLVTSSELTASATLVGVPHHSPRDRHLQIDTTSKDVVPGEFIILHVRNNFHIEHFNYVVSKNPRKLLMSLSFSSFIWWINHLGSSVFISSNRNILFFFSWLLVSADGLSVTSSIGLCFAPTVSGSGSCDFLWDLNFIHVF